MEKVLVPLDGSALADAILPQLARLFAEELHEVVLLRVVPPADVQGAGEQLDDARRHLDLVRRELEGLGARVRVVVRVGDPAGEILAALDELAPDLLAMASHGRGGLRRLVRGSVAEHVLRGSRLPVLLVTPRALDASLERRVQRILVPLDGTARSAAVLPHVEELARRHGAEVVLARVAWEGLSRPLLAARLGTDELLESLRPFHEHLQRDGIPVTSVGAHGDFAAEILRLAGALHTDLIAMTTHGRSGLDRLVDGSVSERVLHRAHTPVLVVRAP